ncbi:ABC transporter ATP-binding protein [Lapidilactobacillus wuchangensis]|uniref:ABC transporter ATP-binding protein n=1 Tax=Lapidilactobacillus wuchangensis TaxID=2486001 RepID=UPI0013DE2686|nr:ABC transporter ATP-binding protein [Lapidilactobacillus wuchangensis]
MTDELRIHDLTFSFSKKKIYDHADLLITNYGVYGLVGPNGSGKTTLFNIITGLLRPKQGTVMLNNKSLTSKDVFENISYVQDNSVLYPYLTGRNHLNFIVKQYDVKQEWLSRVCEYLEVTTFIDLPTKKLSLGQKQRLLIALSLLPNSKILLMDEPLNGLDPDSVIVIRDLLKSLSKKQEIVIVSSHNLEELSKVTKKIIFKTNSGLSLEELSSDVEARYSELYRSKKL